MRLVSDYNKDLVRQNMKRMGTIENKLVSTLGRGKRGIVEKISFGRAIEHNKKMDEDILLYYEKYINEASDLKNCYFIFAQNKKDEDVGFIKYYIHCKRHKVSLEIRLIEVTSKAYQGKGIGYMLLKRFEDVGRVLGAENIGGELFPYGRFADFAREFFKRNGYDSIVDLENASVQLHKTLQKDKNAAIDVETDQLY